MIINETLPRYDDLPVTADGARSAWACFTPDDNVGLLGLQTPQRITTAARLIRRGSIFALNAEIRAMQPPLFGRPIPKHRVLGAEEDTGFDDVIDQFNPQASSQWDALGHAAYRTSAFFNGASGPDVLSGGRNTIDHWARRGIAGRGVLVDLEPLLGGDPSKPVAITVEDLEHCRKASGTRFEPGDILILHTGFLAWYLAQDAAHRSAIADSPTSAGLQHSEAMARYLWDSHISAVASDNPAIEVWPPDVSRSAGPFGVLHRILIGQFGMAMGELWWLYDLVRDCRQHGTWTMFVTSAPLNVAGGISSPANALAIT